MFWLCLFAVIIVPCLYVLRGLLVDRVIWQLCSELNRGYDLSDSFVTDVNNFALWDRCFPESREALLSRLADRRQKLIVMMIYRYHMLNIAALIEHGNSFLPVYDMSRCNGSAIISFVTGKNGKLCITWHSVSGMGEQADTGRYPEDLADYNPFADLSEVPEQQEP